MITGMKDTSEFLDFIISGIKGGQDAVAGDGKVTLPEIIALAFSLANKGRDAAEGFDNIDNELLDLDEHKIEAIINEISKVLNDPHILWIIKGTLYQFAGAAGIIQRKNP